jgi:hypothetical protein
VSQALDERRRPSPHRRRAAQGGARSGRRAKTWGLREPDAVRGGVDSMQRSAPTSLTVSVAGMATIAAPCVPAAAIAASTASRVTNGRAASWIAMRSGVGERRQSVAHGIPSLGTAGDDAG